MRLTSLLPDHWLLVPSMDIYSYGVCTLGWHYPCLLSEKIFLSNLHHSESKLHSTHVEQYPGQATAAVGRDNGACPQLTPFLTCPGVAEDMSHDKVEGMLSLSH